MCEHPAVVPRKPHLPTRQREYHSGYAQHFEGAERVIFQIAIFAQILTATSMVRDWLGVGFWAELPIHFVAIVLAYVLAVSLPARIAPSSGRTRRT